MYFYRDWVIEAYNDNKPFDEFVGRADRRRPAAEPDSRPADRDRLPPQQHHHQRRRSHSRGIRSDLRQGPRRHHRERLSGTHRRMRDLPRSQVRPHRAAGVLCADGVFPEHDAVRDGRQRLRSASRARGAERRGPRSLARAPEARVGDRRAIEDSRWPSDDESVCGMASERAIPFASEPARGVRGADDAQAAGFELDGKHDGGHSS